MKRTLSRVGLVIAALLIVYGLHRFWLDRHLDMNHCLAAGGGFDFRAKRCNLFVQYLKSLWLGVTIVGIGLYFLTPIWFVRWFIHQRRRKMELAPVKRCLFIWSTSFVFLLLIVFSGVWYVEHATVLVHIISLGVAFSIFYATPIALILYLDRKASSEVPEA